MAVIPASPPPGPGEGENPSCTGLRDRSRGVPEGHVRRSDPGRPHRRRTESRRTAGLPGATDGLLPAEMPLGRNRITLHVPLAADEELRAAALANAAAFSEEPDKEVAVGYIDKVSRFPNVR